VLQDKVGALPLARPRVSTREFDISATQSVSSAAAEKINLMETLRRTVAEDTKRVVPRKGAAAAGVRKRA
jgi:hypothetical protein